MTHDTLNAQSTRSWRDIPQPVVPRAMSREGKWRLLMSSVRLTAAVVVGAVSVWAAWVVTASIRENTREMPAAAKALPVKPPQLRTDGVLDNAWLARTLALPPKASLIELDLEKLRARVLAEPQVASATLTKSFPDRLIVTISERSPVARVMTQMLGEQRAFVVARDGVIFAGEGYDRSTLDSLPWLDGITIQPAGGGFRPIAGMEIAAELLSKARLEAEHLYNTWAVISLARLQSDHRLEVRTKDGRNLIYFSTDDDFFRQLSKLDYISDAVAARAPDAKATIDLSLGQDVPVMVTASPEAEAESRPAGRSGSEPPARSGSIDARASQSGSLYRGQTTAATARSPFFSLQSAASGRSAAQSAFFVLPTQSSNTKREL